MREWQHDKDYNGNGPKIQVFENTVLKFAWKRSKATKDRGVYTWGYQ
jgi:hypothetical protein